MILLLIWFGNEFKIMGRETLESIGQVLSMAPIASQAALERREHICDGIQAIPFVMILLFIIYLVIAFNAIYILVFRLIFILLDCF